MYKNCFNINKLKSAFTLAEIVVTLTVIGIIAGITIPNFVKRYTETQNRTKVRKAMAVYESALNKIIILNNFKSDTDFIKWANSDVKNCANTISFFKIAQKINDCRFIAQDKVIWDITNIENSVIILNEKYKNLSNNELQSLAQTNLKTNNDVFAFVGRIDNATGILRINDNSFEQMQSNNTDNKAYMIKLWSYINNNQQVILTASEQLKLCKKLNQTVCNVNVNGEIVTYNKITTSKNTDVRHSCIYYNTPKQQCSGYVSTVPAGDYWITKSIGTISQEDATSEENCSNSTMEKELCSSKGDYYTVAKTKCEKAGGRLGVLAELMVAYNSGNVESGYFWVDEKFCRGGACYVDNKGKFHGDIDGDSSFQVVCIGNN